MKAMSWVWSLLVRRNPTCNQGSTGNGALMEYNPILWQKKENSCICVGVWGKALGWGSSASPFGRTGTQTWQVLLPGNQHRNGNLVLFTSPANLREVQAVWVQHRRVWYIWELEECAGFSPTILVIQWPKGVTTSTFKLPQFPLFIFRKITLNYFIFQRKRHPFVIPGITSHNPPKSKLVPLKSSSDSIYLLQREFIQCIKNKSF